MAIQVQSVSTAAFITGTTLTINKPSGTVDGDLLIAVTHTNDRNISTVPSGWTLIEFLEIVAPDGLNAYYKVASSEGASWDWGIGAAETFGGACLRIDGQASTFLDQSNSAGFSSSATPSYANTITPTEKFSMIVMVVGGVGSTGQTASGYAIATDNPTTWTEHAELGGGGGAAERTLFVATSSDRDATTATGNSSLTFSTATTSGCLMFNLLQDVEQTGTTALLEMNTSSIFVPTSSSGSNVTTDLLEMNSTIMSSEGIITRDEWTNQSKDTGTWTNQNKS